MKSTLINYGKLSLAIILSMAIGYGIVAFIELDWDLTKWTNEKRATSLFIGGLTLICVRSMIKFLRREVDYHEQQKQRVGVGEIDYS